MKIYKKFKKFSQIFKILFEGILSQKAHVKFNSLLKDKTDKMKFASF